MKTLGCLLISLLFVGCGVDSKVEVPKNLQITTVKLIGVKGGHKSQANIVLKDIKTGIIFEETIMCSDWQIEDKLEKYIGRDFKVYETIDIKPEYYGLNDMFCIGIYD